LTKGGALTYKRVPINSYVKKAGFSSMAHHISAKKRIRQTERRSEVNRSRVSRIRTFVKKVETLIATGDKSAAHDALRVAEPELMKGVQAGILHKNTASRKVSRLAARIKSL
jgi:small subunit ribosomal protein S20